MAFPMQLQGCSHSRISNVAHSRITIETSASEITAQLRMGHGRPEAEVVAIAYSDKKPQAMQVPYSYCEIVF